uniref:Uncharacterized protein n=1 Tax=Clastoptera arizonana TaxID=38151 RepID=A0A1B6DFM5_9HEMI
MVLPWKKKIFYVSPSTLFLQTTMPLINCRPTRSIFRVLGTKITLNCCRRLRFFKPKHTTSTPVKAAIFNVTVTSACAARLGTSGLRESKLELFSFKTTPKPALYLV